MNWKKIARKSIVGERVNLEKITPDDETLKDWKEQEKPWNSFWAEPKKYSIEGKDKIDTITLQTTTQLPPKIKLRISKLMKENPEYKEKDLMDLLSDEEQLELMDAQITGKNKDLIQATIEEGLYRTNMITDKESIKDFAEQVMEFEEIALELVEIIRNHNRPLPKEKSEKSPEPPKIPIGE